MRATDRTKPDRTCLHARWRCAYRAYKTLLHLYRDPSQIFYDPQDLYFVIDYFSFELFCNRLLFPGEAYHGVN